VLQGGGALGSDQAGVYEALSTSRHMPDWIAGISVGAINAAIIAGNAPEKRVDRLRAFWEGIRSVSARRTSAILARLALSPVCFIRFMRSATTSTAFGINYSRGSGIRRKRNSSITGRLILRIQPNHDAETLGARGVRRTNDASCIAMACPNAARGRCAHYRRAEGYPPEGGPGPVEIRKTGFHARLRGGHAFS
jgi:hypothetical protein